MQQLKQVLGASDSQFNHSRPNNPSVSKFDLSRITNLTANEGMIIPFDFFEVLPGDFVDLDCISSLDTLPLVQPSLTGYKVLKHFYFQPFRDLWKGAKVWLTKGRTGNINLQVPRVDLLQDMGEVDYKPYTDSNTEYKFKALPIGQHSLASFLGVPSKYSGLYTGISTESDGAFSMDKSYLPYTLVPPDNFGKRSDYIKAIETGFNQYRYPSALPFMMYQSICKYNYVNQNLLQDNIALFPEQGDNDWLLPYSADIVNFISDSEILNNNDASSYSYRHDGVYSSNDTVVSLVQLRYALFNDDFLTTGLPWLQRGDETSLRVDFTEASGDISGSIENTFSNIPNIALKYGSTSALNSLNTTANSYFNYSSSSDSGTIFYDYGQISPKINSTSNTTRSLGILGSDIVNALNGRLSSTLTANIQNLIGHSSLTANQLRELIAMSVWQERNARVDGSYNSMIYQHWLVNPRAEEHVPIYIGGTAEYIDFATVLQNSSSTEDSPLGSTAGFGSSRGQGNVCSHFRVNDYGYIMGILIIKPDTYYQQGVEHALSCENTFDDLVQPEFEGLSPQAIKVKEFYVSDDDDVNEDLLMYQERYMYLKVRQNVNRGLFQCKPDKDRLFGSFTQARWFAERPEFSYQLLCMCPENMRRDFLAFPSYPTFRLQISTRCFVTRHLSYTSQPETFGF